MPIVKTNKLSVYLIKPAFQQSADILECSEFPVPINGIGEFFFEQSHPHPPSWVSDFFGSTLTGGPRILSSSSRGVLLVPIQSGNATQYFAVSFGVGRHLLKEGVFEERFGLKVVLNSVDPGSFRSIAKTTLSSVPKSSHEQMSKNVTAAEFGIDIEQDLVSAVTGLSRDPQFGKMISGKDALSVSVKVDITTIRPFLEHCLARFQSNDYKQNFEWIDQIADVRDGRKEQALNAELLQKLNTGNLSKLWMAIPEVIDWADAQGFRYSKPKRANLQDDLDIGVFLATLKGVPLTLETLKSHEVFLISAASDDVASKWSVFRCIYAEVTLGSELFVLNNGKWYLIAPDFTSVVLNDFNTTTTSSITLPDCTGNDEAAYNLEATRTLTGSCCMDRKLIEHGGGHSKIEFCDVLTGDKRIVHVKRYGGSSVLSHLFAQGIVSGELFVSDANFRLKLNGKLPLTHQLADPNIRPVAGDYEVVYGIISKSSNPLDLPFFSKVSLRNARRRLNGFGYKVAIKKVQKV
jgi:uncharacterized protein (TIGR04141 family)